MDIHQHIKRICEEEDCDKHDMYHIGKDDPLTRLVATFLQQRFPGVKVTELLFSVSSEYTLTVFVDDSIVSWVEVEIESTVESGHTNEDGMFVYTGEEQFIFKSFVVAGVEGKPDYTFTCTDMFLPMEIPTP